MIVPLVNVASVSASGRVYSQGIPLVRARGLSVTGRVTFHSSATAGADIEVYYSPDGKNWDTDPFGTDSITVTAGATKQSTSYIVAPEHGYVKFAVKNNDTGYALTNVMLWYTIQSWPDGVVQEHGSVLRDQTEVG